MILKRSNETDLEEDDKIKKRRKVCETTAIDKFKEVKINMYVQEICSGPMTLNF